LVVLVHVLHVKEIFPESLEKVFFYSSILIFCLGGEKYVALNNTVVTGILDMRPGKHDMHFLVDVELLPHAFVNIPNETIQIGVLLFILLFYFSYNHFVFMI
jgi:sugar (pentulose or hexulose) kinase